MERYFYGELVSDNDCVCEVLGTWDYNPKSENRWSLLSIYPLTKGYENTEFTTGVNINPMNDAIFSEVSKDSYEKIKEDSIIFNKLLGYVGNKFNYDDINCCFNTRESGVIISEWKDINTWESFDMAYQCYYDLEDSTIFVVCTSDNIITDVYEYPN